MLPNFNFFLPNLGALRTLGAQPDPWGGGAPISRPPIMGPGDPMRFPPVAAPVGPYPVNLGNSGGGTPISDPIGPIQGPYPLQLPPGQLPFGQTPFAQEPPGPGMPGQVTPAPTGPAVRNPGRWDAMRPMPNFQNLQNLLALRSMMERPMMMDRAY